METQKTKVRAQFDSRQRKWKIVKQSNNGAGGWAQFGLPTSTVFANRELAEEAVNNLVALYKGLYEKG